MRSLGSLNSKVGRRLTATLLLVAVVPLLIIAQISFRSLESAKLQGIEENTRLEAKLYGMLLFERIKHASSALQRIAKTEESQLLDSDIFEDLTIIEKSQRQKLLQVFPNLEVWRLSTDSPLLYVSPSNDEAGVTLILGSEQGYYAGVLRPQFIWGEKTALPNGKLRVVSGGVSLLESEQDFDASAVGPDSTTNQARWNLYLGRYGGSTWEVSIESTPQSASIFRGELATQFGFIFGLTLLVATFLSLIQIRRVINPLELIKANLVKVGRGGTEAIEPIKSGDEFEEVSHTLVRMAEDIHYSHGLQVSFSDLDHQILAGNGIDHVVKSAADCAVQILGHANLVLCLSEGKESSKLVSPGSGAFIKTLDFPLSDHQNLTKIVKSACQNFSVKHLELVLNAHIRNRPLQTFETQDVFYVPLTIEKRLCGFLLCSLDGDLSSKPEKMGQIEYLVSRVAVATSAILDRRKLDRRAHFDALTNLPNRHTMLNRLDEMTHKAKGENLTFAVLFIDLDGFKEVNDNLGHAVGDRLLREVATRLKDLMPEDATLARFGGDEFVMMVPASNADVSHVQVAIGLINALVKPFRVARNEVSIGASIGSACYPEDGYSATELLKKADLAMYEAKKAGESSLVEYTAELGDKERERQESIEQLAKAIEEKKFVWHLQPKVASASGEIAGAESLVRWQQPSGQYAYPVGFIELAEETGLIDQIGTLAIEAACAHIKAMAAAGIAPVPIAVNFSFVEFNNDNFVDKLLYSIHDAGVDPRLIEIEVTESVAAKSIESANLKLRQFRRAGMKVALDDFGTGYSSLSYLQKLSFDTVKIDQSFVARLEDQVSARAIVKSVIQLAHTLGKTVVAEGVETARQEGLLRDLSCDYLQGFKYSPAVPIEEFIQQIRAPQKAVAASNR